MLISDLELPVLVRLLHDGELFLNISPFMVKICSDIPDLAADIQQMYGDFECGADGVFADYHVGVVRRSQWWPSGKQNARFLFDGLPFFTPLPEYQALAMLEWGLNWCIAAHSHRYLIFHAAVIERDGMAAILPAPPGSGKSTLCAALVCRGWRLLTDELALFDLDSGLISGMARPINLKNQSIGLIQAFEPSAQMARVVPNTSKGTVSLMRPPVESVRAADRPATPHWIITPQYKADSPPLLESKGGAETFMLMAEQSFNYEIHAQRGFNALGNLIDRTACFKFSYSSLDDAVATFERLLASNPE